MRRGCTEKYVVNVSSEQTIGTVYITFSQGSGFNLVQVDKSFSVSGTSASVTITLSQEETLKFNAGEAVKIQARCVNSSGDALGSEINQTVMCLPILKEGVINA